MIKASTTSVFTDAETSRKKKKNGCVKHDSCMMNMFVQLKTTFQGIHCNAVL